DGTAQRLLANRQTAWTTSKQVQTLRQACQEGLGRQQFHTSGRQFNGQGQAIQSHAYLRNCSCVGGSQLKAGEDVARPLHKEGHCCRLGDVLVVSGGETGQ